MPGTWPTISRSSHPSICPSIDPSSTPSFTSSRPLPPIRSTRSSPSSTCSPAISSKQQPEKLLIGVNYDVAKIFRYAWPHMSSEQKHRAASKIRDMLHWTLNSSLQDDGSFQTVP